MPHRFTRPLLALVAATVTLVASPTIRASGDDLPDIEAARAGLAAYLEANRPDSPSTSTDIPGCPAIALDRLQQALGDVGIDDPIEDWGTEIEWNEYEDIGPDLMGIVCGGDADGDAHDGDFEMAAGVFAVDAGDDERAQEVVDQLGFGTLEFEPAEVPGGELASTCLDDPENSLSLCLSFWSNDGFVLGIALSSDAREIPRWRIHHRPRRHVRRHHRHTRRGHGRADADDRSGSGIHRAGQWPGRERRPARHRSRSPRAAQAAVHDPRYRTQRAAGRVSSRRPRPRRRRARDGGR